MGRRAVGELVRAGRTAAGRRAVGARGPVACALLLFFVAACGQQSAPPAAVGHTSAQASGPAVPPPSAVPTGLADLCTLLSPQDRSTAGITVLGKSKDIAGARACDWTVPGTFGVTVTYDEQHGLAELDVATKNVTKTTVGTHPALKVADKKAADGTCAVLLGVGDGASVQIDVSNSGFSDTPLACRRAATVAGLVEPKLP
ncbi:Protein of unknown function [Amycolatopsis tolypomycina]|uniref:DUF3558 domain-containing protein n=1 Tax=Amycolatopsis tolypomycina TaxID=208445 RepID=A0A1H4YZ87_9PSEU|nr:Protein of unknown function [Amycolatopsis tolypomycina]